MVDTNIIIENLHNPEKLEQLYRQDPDIFKDMFSLLYQDSEYSETLEVWNQRLNYSEEDSKLNFSRKELIIPTTLAIFAGIVSRGILYFIDLELIAPINMIFGIVPFIAIYFMFKNKLNIKYIISLTVILLVSIVAINIVSLSMNDITILALLHFPIFLWLWVGLTYIGIDFKDVGKRLSYLKFNGEFIILYGIMALSGIVLTLITMQLFTLIELDISEFYFPNIVLFGAASLSVISAYLVSKNLKIAKNIAPYIARIFGPLVLITLLVYLISVLIVGKNPFLDRNFLLTFNIILLFVLIITLYSISESKTNQKKNISDYVNISLILLALIVDSVALSAIIFRLTSYGITPNRFVMLGINVIIWINLAWILVEYFKFLRNKKTLFSVQSAITNYLPIYGAWSLFVMFVLPFIF